MKDEHENDKKVRRPMEDVLLSPSEGNEIIKTMLMKQGMNDLS